MINRAYASLIVLSWPPTTTACLFKYQVSGQHVRLNVPHHIIAVVVIVTTMPSGKKHFRFHLRPVDAVTATAT